MLKAFPFDYSNRRKCQQVDELPCLLYWTHTYESHVILPHLQLTYFNVNGWQPWNTHNLITHVWRRLFFLCQQTERLIIKSMLCKWYRAVEKDNVATWDVIYCILRLKMLKVMEFSFKVMMLYVMYNYITSKGTFFHTLFKAQSDFIFLVHFWSLYDSFLLIIL